MDWEPLGRAALHDPEEMPPLPPQNEVVRRFRAALAYAGTTVQKLGRQLQRDGYKLGPDTLYAVQQGKRVLNAVEAQTIARYCNLPYEFFTIDFSGLSPAQDLQARLEQVEARQDAIQAAEDELRELAQWLGRMRRQPGGNSDPPSTPEEEGSPGQPGS